MIPQTQARKARNSNKVNLLISFTFHALLVIVLFYFAAREGLLGKKLQKISVTLVKEKPPEKPKPPEPKVEPPKVVPPKVEPPKLVATKPAAPPMAAPPVVAPANNQVPAFDFGGGRTVETGDPTAVYQYKLQQALYTSWDRPDDINDTNFVVLVPVTVARDGSLAYGAWSQQSPDARWNDSVRAAIGKITRLDSSPPTNFPPQVTIRFDTVAETEALIQ